MPFQQDYVVQALFRDFPSAVFFADPQKRLRAANPAALKLFGYALDDLIDQPVRLLFASDEEYQTCLTKREREAITQVSVDSLYSFQRSDGSIFQGQMRSTLVNAADSTVSGFIGVITDVTPMIRLEEKHKDAERLLDAALGTIDQGFAIYDKDERLVIFNAAYRRLFGDVDIKAGMTGSEIIDLASRSGSFGQFDTDAERLAWADSRLATLRLVSSPFKILRYADGRLWRCVDRRMPDGSTVALRVDVTEVQAALTAVERREREYLTLLQNLPEMVCRISRDLTVLFVNDGYARFFNRPIEDNVGRNILELVVEERRDILRRTLEGLSADRLRASYEAVHPQADGSVCVVEWTFVAVLGENEPTEFVAVGRDVTEFKRRNEALSLFAATVAHDLKAPLRHIASFSEMLVEDLADGRHGELAFYAGNIRQSAERMQRLIQNLLEYAQIAHRITKHHCVDLHGVVRDVMALMETTVSETGARIEVGRLPSISGDQELLKRLAQNLIGNALKYRRPDRQPVVRIYGSSHALFSTLVVEDEGIGIEPAHEKRIFDLFQRLHRDESVYKGTGIGLAIAKRIVESHGGTIRLDTSYREGARFVVTFPPEADATPLPADATGAEGSCAW
ncbi:PAS domain S-box protein [Rhizobium sp. SG2393]|uniref:PAS domain S-box protein n=1 Tax=Rhizobium sp. SG2393 TaxID=3276279 RepID=UPI003670B8DC